MTAVIMGERITWMIAVVAVGWCGVVIWRLPRDLRELRDLWRRYRRRESPDTPQCAVVNGQPRERRKDCAREFWSTLAIQALFFWPVTVIVIAVLIWAVHRFGF